MNSIVISLETEIPRTDLGKDVSIQVNGVSYTGKILLIMTHEEPSEESTVILRGPGLKTGIP